MSTVHVNKKIMFDDRIVFAWQLTKDNVFSSFDLAIEVKIDRIHIEPWQCTVVEW